MVSVLTSIKDVSHVTQTLLPSQTDAHADESDEPVT